MRIQTLRDMLLLVGRKARLNVLRDWSQEQRDAAEKWAAVQHLRASDNHVRRVPEPTHVAALRRPKP